MVFLVVRNDCTFLQVSWDGQLRKYFFTWHPTNGRDMATNFDSDDTAADFARMTGCVASVVSFPNLT